MFKDISLKASYNSYEDNMSEDFYIPILSDSIKYDRAMAYFSAKALAYYAKGMEAFAKNGSKCRLIISTQISEDDYNLIKDGYRMREQLENQMIESLNEELNIDEECCFSNLAYLIAEGIVDVKIAFTSKGIFHDKFGIVEDCNENTICFRGSTNETEAGLNYNFESFDLTCSWLASEFDYSKITYNQRLFEKLWNNKMQDMVVCNAHDVILREILKHNRGNIIVDKIQLEENCIILDYDDKLFLNIKCDLDVWNRNSSLKNRLRRYVEKEELEKHTILFKEACTYCDFEKIINIFEKNASVKGYRFFVTNRLREFIANKQLYIEKRAELGRSIKCKDSRFNEEFELFKRTVNNALARPLREQQMWDSFFMCTMKKSSNFSVPGAGKTAAVLGAYAYLKSKNIVNKIVMIGPKNSFSSWTNEFKACFGEKEQLKCYDTHDPKYKNNRERKQALTFDTGNCNLLLFNYESVGAYEKELEKIVCDKTLLVLDEVHKIKLVGGCRYETPLAIGKLVNYSIALTGTPIPNSYLDLYNLLHILYNDEYDEFFGFTEYLLKNPNPGDIEYVNDKIYPFFCRTTKEQLGVPGVLEDKIINIESSHEENEIFNILKLKYAKNPLALIIRILQLESNPKLLLSEVDLKEYEWVLDTTLEEDAIDFVNYSEDISTLIKNIGNTKKFNSCIEKCEALVSENKKVIIWCIFTDSIERIERTLTSRGISAKSVYGKIDYKDRNQRIDEFKQGKFDVLVTNPHTLAESVSLHNICHDAIYFEYSYNLVHLLQSKDRIHRLGLNENQYTQYYFMEESFVTREGETYSLDDKIYNRLKEKERIMLEAIDRGVLEPGTLPEDDVRLILAELKLDKID